MSHEIRTPIHGVTGFIPLLKQTRLTRKQLGYLEKMDLSSRQLLYIVNDILDFSKMEAGKLKLETIDFDLQQTVEEVVESGGEGANRWFHLVIMEGRKREVRRLWEAVGATVSRLKRVRYGPIILDSKVKSGQWRELDEDERKALLEVAGLKDNKPWGSLARDRRRRSPPHGAS